MGDIGASGWGSLLAGAGTAAGGAASASSIFSGKNQQGEMTDAIKQLMGTTNSSAQGILNQTAPLRAATAGTLFDVLTGGRNSNLRVFAPERETVESQFGRARDNMLNTGVRGGELNTSLANLNMARAQTLGGLEADVRKNAFVDGCDIIASASSSYRFTICDRPWNARTRHVRPFRA